MLVDSHCHLNMLDLAPFNDDLNQVLTAAKEAGIGYMLCVSVDMNTLPAVIKIAESYSNVFASVGLHPTEITDAEPSIEQLVQFASHPKVVAIGETGLDYYRDDTQKMVQQQRFRRHIQAAKIVNKPLIVHTRMARTDTIQILKEENASSIGGVLHCFTESWEMAQQALAENFYISFSGIVTFQNAKELKEIAKLVPLDRMLVETDAPFLAPMPHRGKSNQPAYVRLVAEYIAGLRSISFESVAEQTTKNFFNLFKQASHNAD